jgi:hypothetical protein
MTAALKVYSAPSYDIDLAEPPEERWRTFCKAEGDNIHSILSDVHQSIDEELLGHLYPPIRSLVKTLGSGAGWIAHTVSAMMYGEEYTAEIKGMAKYAEVPLGDLMLGNLIYDLTSLSEMYGCGCSSASFDINSTPVLVRNMDWVNPRSTGKHTRLIKFHRGSNSYTSVGVTGMVGVVSAICSQWAVTVNQAPTVKKAGWLDCLNPVDLFRWPVLQRVRAVCDRMSDYNHTVLGLRAQPVMVPFFAHVVGRDAKEHSIVSHVGSDTHVRTPRKRKLASLVQTNHYITPKLKKHNPENGEDFIWDTYTRHDAVQARVMTETPQNVVAALNVLKGDDVTTGDTMQQMLLWPARETMVLKTRNG